MYRVKLQTVNNLLLVAILLVSGYVIVMPMLPEMQYRFGNHTQRQKQLQQQIIARPVTQHKPDGGEAAEATPTANTLTIPSMLLDAPINEGPVRDMYKVLNKGIWRWPLGSTPDKGGNTVLLGHRFTYTNPRGVLYFLNKVAVGDSIGISWNAHKYVYKVTQVRVVPPSDTSVVAPTDKPTLTVYTCTPLWKPLDRLVVAAELEQQL